MPLTKPNQQLHRGLREAAVLFKWSRIDLMKLAVRLSEAGNEEVAWELLKIGSNFSDSEDLLTAFAEEVKAGRIVRGKVE
ncbi:hypothetical protein [Pseudomonas fluorescens]|uniref:Uncharacterized protein n=1 Tax=Pseudomonas fluorescens TaxID=294 RepID=A0A5E7RWX0_PSEFL|nr:hypothetical protein [Pseudomonas fluorescens]VVP78826.1 hypothetical protein PS928_00518 [Pseudomonas fluorescens]